MPVEFVKDQRTGRLVRRGSLSGAGPVMPQAASAPPRRKEKPKEKPWWGQLLNAAQYEGKQFSSNPLGRLATLTGARRLANDVAFEARQLSKPQTAITRLATYGLNLQSPGVGSRASLAAISAGSDALRNGIEAYQRFTGAKRGDYANTGLGRFVDDTEDRAYRQFGVTPRQEQEGLERFSTDMQSQVIAGAVALGTGSAVLGAASKAPLIGRAAAGAQNLLNPMAGKTAAGRMVRAALAGAYEEGITTPFVDNTGGSSAAMVNLLLGREVVPDPVQPGMDRVDSAQAAIVPNAAFGAVMGAGVPALFAGIGRGRRAASEVSRKLRRGSGRKQTGCRKPRLNPALAASPIRCCRTSQKQHHRRAILRTPSGSSQNGMAWVKRPRPHPRASSLWTQRRLLAAKPLAALSLLSRGPTTTAPTPTPIRGRWTGAR